MQHRTRTLSPEKAGNTYGKFTPSPITGVHFMTKYGMKIIPMNRKERRAQKIRRLR